MDGFLRNQPGHCFASSGSAEVLVDLEFVNIASVSAGVSPFFWGFYTLSCCLLHLEKMFVFTISASDSERTGQFCSSDCQTEANR